MGFIADLWLPILLSAVGVFVVSSIVHMVVQIHKNDFKHLANEENVLASMREHGVTPGEYMFPAAECMKDMGNPEYIEKCNLGPVGYMTIFPNGMWNMNKSLLQWFVFSIVVGIFTAYITNFGLAPGADFGDVMRLSGTVATMSYGLGHIPNSIWKGVAWSTTAKFIFDGVLYGVTTGILFAVMWPDAA